MYKQIFIINGYGRVGKDTFVKLVAEETKIITRRDNVVTNFSSIDKVIKAAEILGYEGKKSEKDRKFLSILKKLSGDYYDTSFKSMKDKVNEFYNDKNSQILFLHIREPEEITRAVKEFNAKTILIVRKSVKHIMSNDSDKNVFDYKYDYVIDNNGTIEELRKKVKSFLEGMFEEVILLKV